MIRQVLYSITANDCAAALLLGELNAVFIWPEARAERSLRTLVSAVLGRMAIRERILSPLDILAAVQIRAQFVRCVWCLHIKFRRLGRILFFFFRFFDAFICDRILVFQHHRLEAALNAWQLGDDLL